ncbi:hypothetical protein AB0L82_04235 [Nocardia sp. NPDC052001]|uniref:hypothetical protein n=1 Tax=Nocardia sp. NPDC052001 TaxID=3154853 RepID=UPI003416655F
MANTLRLTICSRLREVAQGMNRLVGGLSGIGHKISASLTEFTSGYAYAAKGKLVPLSNELRNAAERVLATDGRHTRFDLEELARRGPDTWTLPDRLPRTRSGEIVRGADLDGQNLWFWSGDVSKDVLHNAGDKIWGVSYPLAKEDIPYLRNLAKHHEGSIYTEYAGTKNIEPVYAASPWAATRDNRSPLFLHAEADRKTGLFHLKGDVQPYGTTNPHLSRNAGGETIVVEPEAFAKVVANDPSVRRALADRGPDDPIAMLSGDLGKSETAARFAGALQREDGFARDIYFANGTQIAWLARPSGWSGLSVQLASKELIGQSAAWTRYAPGS